MPRLKYEFKHLAITTDAGYDPSYYEFPVEKADDFKLDFGFHQEAEIDKGVSSTFTIYGAGAAYIQAWLIDHANAPIHTILCRVTDTLAGKSLGEYLVKTDSLEWCDGAECKYSITLVQYDPEMDCIKSTLISDNHQDWFPDGGFPGPGMMHPRFRYCDDIKPQALQNWIAIQANTLLLTFNIITSPISLLLSALSWLGLDPGIEDAFNDFVVTINDAVFGWFLGCRRLHPSPFVRTYMQNVCDKCGLTFQSSIFNDGASTYYNLAHLFAPAKYGVVGSSSKDWIPQNAPYYTLWSYARSLQPVFNAKYMKRDSTFIFERRDYFTGSYVFDFTGADKSKLVGNICYSWSGEKKAAYRSFKYTDDAFDQTGNEAKHRFNDNTYFLNNPLFEGERAVQVTDYSPQRYTEDGIDRRLIFDLMVSGFGLPVIDVVQDVLLMSADTTSTGKLIMWDGASDMDDARTNKVELTDFTTAVYDPAWNSDSVVIDGTYGSHFVYNYNMIYDDLANTTYQNLSSFWEIDNPTGTKKNIDWHLDIVLCSEDLINLLFTNPADTEINPKLDFLVKLNADYEGYITGITIDYDKNLITLKGKVK